MRNPLSKRLVTRLLISQDLWKWQQSTRSTAGKGGPAHRPLLLCDLVGSYATHKAQALFALALRDQGFRPVVLLPSRNKLAERIYNSVQPTEFLDLRDFDSCNHREQAESLLHSADTFEQLMGLEIDGVRVGRNVLSLALRRLRTGRLDRTIHGHRTLVAEILAQSLSAKAACQKILDTIHPDIALFNERGYTPAGELFDLCLASGVDTIQWLGAPQADRLLFKRYHLGNRATHPLALDNATWAQLGQSSWTKAQETALMNQLASHYGSGAWFNRQQLQDGKRVMAPDEIRAQLAVAPGRKIAAIFCHILYDATFFYGDSLFKDYEEWLVETVRCAIANPHLDWIVKVHPVNVWRSRMDGQPMEQLEAIALKKAFGALPPHVRIMPADTDINTWGLFQTIDYSLTVRGTVGMETPCFGIPTVTAGTGRYSHRGFTIDPATPDDYRRLLAELHTVPRLDHDAIRAARLYAWGTFFRRPIPITSFIFDYQATDGQPSILSNNVHFLGKQADLDHIGQWMAQSRDADLLAPELP